MVFDHQPREWPLAHHQQRDAGRDSCGAAETQERVDAAPLRHPEISQSGNRGRLERSRYAITLYHHPFIGAKRRRRGTETVDLGVLKNSWVRGPPIGLGSVTNPFRRIS